jgi:hypothetical protein
MRSYGLIEGRGTRNRVSEIGQLATFGQGSEKHEALLSALKNVPLWRSLYERFGDRIKEDGFTALLVKMTGAAHPDAEKNSSRLLNHYIDDLKYISSVEAPQKSGDITPPGPPDEARGGRSNMEGTNLSAEFVHIKYRGYDVKIDLKDPSAVKDVDSLWISIKAKLEAALQ